MEQEERTLGRQMGGFKSLGYPSLSKAAQLSEFQVASFVK